MNEEDLIKDMNQKFQSGESPRISLIIGDLSKIALICFGFSAAYFFISASNYLKEIGVAEQNTRLVQKVEEAKSKSNELSLQLKERAAEINNGPSVMSKAEATLKLKERAAADARQAQTSQAPAQVLAEAPVQAGPMKLGVWPDGTAMPDSEKREQAKQLIAGLPDNFTINWDAENERARIYVFTDVTCPYCKKLHLAVPELNAAGISVRYFMYPRDLPKSNSSSLSPTGKQFFNIWCSADQKAALDEAFDGYRVRAANCSDLPAGETRIIPPIADHYMLGSLFEVAGTPTMVTNEGRVLSGFKDAKRLITDLGL